MAMPYHTVFFEGRKQSRERMWVMFKVDRLQVTPPPHPNPLMTFA